MTNDFNAWLAAVLLVIVGFSSGANAQPPEITTENVEAWADEVFNDAFEDKHFAGAAVAVVKDGALIFSRGYGYADYEAQTPMDPKTTLVRTCSTTKLFVATALMQLVDKGEIASLDDPANLYLKRIALPDTKNGPITLRDLTTHRGGFEDSYFNAGTTKHVETPVDAKTVQRLIPKVVRPSGELSVYSNANTALQGVLIEDITGMPLREYLKKNVLNPLGMTRSQLNDNPPAPKGSARSHVLYQDGRTRKVPLVPKHPVYAPSGGLFSTAEEMAMFVAAHLDMGRTSPSPVLSPESFAAMQAPAARNHPALGALGVQFFLEELNGRMVVNHGCGLPGFTSYIAMLPDVNAGMFVSVVSTSEPVGEVEEFIRKFRKPDEGKTAVAPNRAAKFYWSFLQRFVGFPEPEFTEMSDSELKRYEGHYKVERRTHTNMLLALELIAPEAFMMRVDRTDGGLSLSGSAPYHAIGANVFQRGSHPARIYAFSLDENGRAKRLVRSTAQAHTRVPVWQSSFFKRDVLLWSLLILGSGVFMGLGADTPHRRANTVGRACAAAILIGVVLIMATVTLNYQFGKNIEHSVNEGHTLRLWAIVILANAMIASAVVVIGQSVRNFARAGQGLRLFTRLHALLLIVSGAGLIYVLASVNLLGVHLP